MDKKHVVIIFLGFLLGLVLLSMLVFSSCEKSTKSSDQNIAYWTCGMHPSVKSDKPGKCPICNMDLVPVYKEGHDQNAEEGKGSPTLKTSLRERQLAGVEVAEVTFRKLYKKIRTVGEIAYDERRVSLVTAWIPGRIDKLFIDYTGQKIKKGEPLAILYSPELISTEKEFILALSAFDEAKNKGDDIVLKNRKFMLESTRKRLVLWGIPEQEIGRLQTELSAKDQITIYAPVNGTVVEKTVVEGQYVKEGQSLYKVADLSSLWILTDVYEYEMGWIKLGQEMKITAPSFPGETFTGNVTFIDPTLNMQSRSIKVRTELANLGGRFKPGMFVDVVFYVLLNKGHFPEMGSHFNDQGELLAIPASAVLNTGKRIIVYKEKNEGEYIGQKIKIGRQAGNYYPVLAGLKEGDRVVVQGNFLIDSQTQLTGLESKAFDAALGEKQQITGHKH